MLKKELKAIFTNKKMLISICAVLFIPIMYSGMFLWAFWDPYEQLEDLPVAIVNNDTGAELDGEAYQLGDEFVAKLKESKEFNFKFVDEKTGYKNLEDQEYYILVEIPEDFSENATTLMDDEPKKLELKYVPNESYNFLSSQIGETAVQKIQMALQEKVTETYAATMFDTLTKMADGFGTADEGAGQLLSGIEEVKDGSKTLEEKLGLLAEKQVEFTDGTNQLYSGSVELQNGVKTLTDGLGQLSDGQSQLVEGSKTAEDGTKSLAAGITKAHEGIGTLDDKMGEVITGTSQLKTGADQLSEYLGQLQSGATSAATGATSVAKGAADVNAGIAALQSQLSSVIASLPAENQTALNQAFDQLKAGTAALETGSSALEEGNQELATSAEKIATGSSSLSSNITTLNEGQKALQTGIQKLDDGAAQLETGATQLQTGQSKLSTGLATFAEKLNEAKAGGDKLVAGADALTSGVSTLEDGSKQLADGSSQLADGSTKITTGTTELAEGATEFKTKLNDAATESSEINANEATYNMVAEPVTVNNEGINEVPNYGTGFAPYFLSLGLFVGALLFSIIFPLRDPVGVPKNGFSWFFSKFAIFAGAGILQAILASVLILFLLDIEVQSIPLFILFSIITSLTFVTLVQLLVSAMGDPGRFVAIIVLILQLTTSAGTFPLELIPAPLQWFNSLLPMTYSVRGFKEVISSGNFSLMWTNGYILFGYLAAFIILTLLYFIVKHKKSYSGVSESESEISEAK